MPSLMETHDANSNAMSEMAYVPPYLPERAFIPIALVDSTHFVGDIVKAFNPASFLTPSNSMGICDHSDFANTFAKLPAFNSFPVIPFSSMSKNAQAESNDKSCLHEFADC